MKQNSKVVPFKRSAAYVHHRALKNMRERNPVDAVELMRSAVEHSPENQEYWLDLAEMYCEMGCHTQSNRILLDIIAGENAPAECYYGLALNQIGLNAPESARQALSLYKRYARDDAYGEDVDALVEELDGGEEMQRPLNRRIGRAVRIADKACAALRDEDAQKACQLFERSFALYAGQPEMRAMYAVALCMCGESARAMNEALASAESFDISPRGLCIAGQACRMCGDVERAKELTIRAQQMRPDGPELRMLAYSLCELEMYAQANDAIRAALRETPYDRTLLHLRAAALHRSGTPDAQVAALWLRILRMDPEDSIARYYHEAAVEGTLAQHAPELYYQVPEAEYRRRLMEIAARMNSGVEEAIEAWKTDARFRELIVWAAETGNERCAQAAVMVLATAADARSESVLRELLYRRDVDASIKLHAMFFLQLRGAELRRLLPPAADARDALLPDSKEILNHLPVGERQLVRLAADGLEQDYGIRPIQTLAVLWVEYRRSCAEANDPLVCTQEAAAALAWNYLLQRGMRVSVRKLAQRFDCRARRMVFYARRIAAAFDQIGEIEKHEDH